MSKENIQLYSRNGLVSNCLLFQALNCSAFVPFYSGIIPPKYKGVVSNWMQSKHLYCLVMISCFHVGFSWPK